MKLIKTTDGHALMFEHEITDVDCPDCGNPMYRWTDGDHPVNGMTPRLKCTQCGRWIYHTPREMEAEK